MPKIPCIFVPTVTCLSNRLGLVSALGIDIHIHRHWTHAYCKFRTTACTLPSAIHSPQISGIKNGWQHMRVGIFKELKGAPLSLFLVIACLSCFYHTHIFPIVYMVVLCVYLSAYTVLLNTTQHNVNLHTQRDSNH
jgi:ribosomal protein S27E